MATVTDPPRSTPKERLHALKEEAESVHIDHTQPITRYYISSKQLFETASYEAKHGNNEKAFILVMRFLDLFVTRIPKHPKYHTVPENLRHSTNALSRLALDLGADLKLKLLTAYEEEFKLDTEKNARREQGLQPHNGTTSGDLDALVDRIERLNATTNIAEPRSALIAAGEDLPSYQATVDNPGAWSGNQLGSGRIGTEAWPSNVHVNYDPSQPMVDRSTKPRAPPRGRISSTETLRTVRVPGDLVRLFAAAASENTHDKNIETCGNLWGVRDKGAYVVTHVLIPKQKATDSYCEDLDEGMASDFAIAGDLIQLGWIHTHPSQTAFLSSVDMHMQHGYQIMLPEAIAIVLAPTFSDVGFFRLSDYGMDVVTKCREGTTFHVHDEIQPLFERIDDVELDENLATKLKDFR